MLPRLAEFRTGTRTFQMRGVLERSRVMESYAVVEGSPTVVRS